MISHPNKVVFGDFGVLTKPELQHSNMTREKFNLNRHKVGTVLQKRASLTCILVIGLCCEQAIRSTAG